MDKRTLIAALLMALVIVVTPRLFSTKAAPPRPDSAAVKAPAESAKSTPAQPLPSAATPAPAVSPLASARPTSVAATLRSPRASFALLNPGATIGDVTIPGYHDLKPGPSRGANAVISPVGGKQVSFRLAAGNDTIALDTLSFTVTQTPTEVTFASAPITLRYRTTSDDYRLAVTGEVAGATQRASLVVDLPSGLRSVEADTLDDARHLAFGYKIPRRDVTSVPFGKLDPGSARVDTGSFQWVSTRSKYWLIALMQPVLPHAPSAVPATATGIFRDILLRGAPRTSKVADAAYARTTLPLKNGSFAFDVYVGPQSWAELHALGNDLENVNPYAGWLHAVVQPFETIVMRVLLWMKATLRVNYGWVLVQFGVVIRFVLWPLNTKAMRSSIQMQRLQPELTAIQAKYKTDPEKQRDALMKVYSDHGMSPFSPMLGCLPMLLPMPVLFALYFVFQNTIEFRGVSFLWLPDLSLRDPFYIIPLVMGGSMFLLSWIGLRSSPPNPQAKMMSYMMPVLFTFLFLNFASGLNLYYAVQNIAALPQQWFLTKERARSGVAAPVMGAAARKT
jgi:YidC/Oxa1 family membrane protein insertase